VMDEDALRKFLEERCLGANFRDGDIQALVDVGFDTEVTFAAATKEYLTHALPTRFGVVGVLLKAFVKPVGMFPCQGCRYVSLSRVCCVDAHVLYGPLCHRPLNHAIVLVVLFVVQSVASFQDMILSFDFFKFVPSIVFPISWKACILTSSCSWYVFFSRTIRFSCDGLFDAFFHD
jgi:hypothetical protein